MRSFPSLHTRCTEPAAPCGDVSKLWLRLLRVCQGPALPGLVGVAASRLRHWCVHSIDRGAACAQVYLCSASPPVRFPNVYGVDMPTRREFVAYNLEEDEIRQVPYVLYPRRLPQQITGA